MPAVPANACDICSAPGRCCNGFVLNSNEGTITFWREDAEIEVKIMLAREKLPFTIKVFEVFQDEFGSGGEYVMPRFSCDALLPNGRCGTYIQRPQVCKDYTPGQDPLCVFYDKESQ